MTCYCNSGQDFQHCCEPFIFKYDFPATAEQLMRSRYSAYCLNDLTYLNETSLTPHESMNADISWITLDVIHVTHGKRDDSAGTVEFNALFKQDHHYYILHEKSTFKRVANQWRYVNGDSRIIPHQSPYIYD